MNLQEIHCYQQRIKQTKQQLKKMIMKKNLLKSTKKEKQANKFTITSKIYLIKHLNAYILTNLPFLKQKSSSNTILLSQKNHKTNIIVSVILRLQIILCGQIGRVYIAFRLKNLTANLSYVLWKQSISELSCKEMINW